MSGLNCKELDGLISRRGYHWDRKQKRKYRGGLGLKMIKMKLISRKRGNTTKVVDWFMTLEQEKNITEI